MAVPMPETAARVAAAAPAGQAASRGFMLLLVGLTALAPFSLQVFLPALPVIQADFRVTPAVAQLVLSLSILASAFAMLAYGPLSDRFGRRPVLLAGLVAFAAGSVFCALAPSVGTLIGGRVVQAVGAAAGMVLARAIVRDLHDREQLGERDRLSDHGDGRGADAGADRGRGADRPRRAGARSSR